MGVFKRGGIWWIDYRYQGRRIRESTGTSSRKRAEQLLTKRQAEVSRGDSRLPRRHQRRAFRISLRPTLKSSQDTTRRSRRYVAISESRTTSPSTLAPRSWMRLRRC
jgi:hypothetical protein